MAITDPKNSEIKYKSSIKPHARQRLLLECKARFVDAACGRRFGKTLIASEKVAREACKNKRGAHGLYWWTAPTFKRSSKAFEDFERALRPIIKRALRSSYTIELVSDVKIEFLSLEKWENLKGDGLDGCIMDEASRCPHRAWTELIRPALSDKKGWCWKISTPLGKNWFYHDFKKGIEGEATYDPTYQSFSFPTADNPYIDLEEIEAARRELPEDIFQQEYEAKFLEEAAGVFRGLSLCRPTPVEIRRDDVCIRRKRPDEVCILGVDLGKHRDFTVLTVVATPPEGRRRVIYFARMNKLDWSVQQAEITRVARDYQAIIWIDASGPGDRMCEDLMRAGVGVVPFQYSSPINRTEVLRCLQIEISTGRVAVPEEPFDLMEPFWREASAFEYKLTPAGKLTMGPPDGEHDDCVASMALAVMGSVRDTSIVDLRQYSAEVQTNFVKRLAEDEKARSNNLLALPIRGSQPCSFFSEFGANYFANKTSHEWRDSTVKPKPPMGLTRPFR